ncbi:MAG: lycopene cyclase family protein [Chitinophagaceae bacterium]
MSFYNYCFERIRQQPNISVAFGEIKKIESNEKETFIELDNQEIHADYIFNSILFEKPTLKKNEYYLLQHFKGWMIETKEPVFKVDEATLMDFRVSQQHGTTFVYVMPFSETKALVEYNLVY